MSTTRSALEDEGDITVGGEPWTDEQLEGMRALALKADLRRAQRLLESYGYRVALPPAPDGAQEG